MSEIDATFKPFEKNLDFKKTLTYLKTAINKADDGELFLERSQNESFLFDDRKLKQSSFNFKEGFGIRAIKGVRSSFSFYSPYPKSLLVLELLKEKELLTLILQKLIIIK